MHQFFLFLSAFAASAVEMVEALTLVLAAGVTRGWRSTLLGAAAGLVVLGTLVVALGSALTSIPLGALRLVVGSLLLVFGLQWLRKAVLRAAGLVAGHDEAALFDAARTRIAEAGDAPTKGTDWYAFTISFKGVLLEGLEVAFIVLTFGGAQRDVGLAGLAAAAAFVVVAVVGAAVRGPLTRVPENALKFGVGVMLTAFGTFWAAEGAGAAWPGDDSALPVLIALVLAMALAGVRVLRVASPAEIGGGAA